MIVFPKSNITVTGAFCFRIWGKIVCSDVLDGVNINFILHILFKGVSIFLRQFLSTVCVQHNGLINDF